MVRMAFHASRAATRTGLNDRSATWLRNRGAESAIGGAQAPAASRRMRFASGV